MQYELGKELLTAKEQSRKVLDTAICKPGGGANVDLKAKFG